MNKYIILPRFQFTSLYKYGEIYVNSSSAISADMPAIALTSKLTEIFKKLPYFEYDDEYIILGIKTLHSETNEINVSIDDVDEIIAFSQQAKISIESKVDTRINISVTNWAENILKNMELYYQRRVMEKGIDAIWKISGFEGDWRNEDFLPPELLSDLELGLTERGLLKSKDKQQNNFLIQAIVYDRNDFFPGGYDGYLFDIFEVLCNNLEKGFSFSKTDLYSWLINQHSQGYSNCWILYKNDTTNEKLKNIKSALASRLPSDKIRWENSLAWFFAQKADIQNKGFFDLKQFRTELDKRYDEFVAERKMAIILLGAFFGYKYFYDALYDQITLKFFKKPTSISKHTKTVKSPVQLELSELGNTAEKEVNAEHTFDSLIKEDLQNNKLVEKVSVETSIVKGNTTEESDSNDEKARIVEFDIEKEENIPQENNEIAQDDSLKPIEVTPAIDQKIAEITASKNLKLTIDVISWVIECYNKLGAIVDENKKELLENLLLSDRPKGFREKKIKQIIEALSKDNLL